MTIQHLEIEGRSERKRKSRFVSRSASIMGIDGNIARVLETAKHSRGNITDERALLAEGRRYPDLMAIEKTRVIEKQTTRLRARNWARQ